MMNIDQKLTLAHQCTAIVDAARAQHPEASAARLAAMFQLCADAAHVEAWREAITTDGAPDVDVEALEMINDLRKASEQRMAGRRAAGMPAFAPWLGTEEREGSALSRITADIDCDVTGDPRLVRQALDRVTARLLELLTDEAQIGSCVLPVILQMAADCSLAEVAAHSVEDLEKVQEIIDTHTTVLHAAIVENSRSLGCAHPEGWEQDVEEGLRILREEETAGGVSFGDVRDGLAHGLN
jgi:hypothetical protein